MFVMSRYIFLFFFIALSFLAIAQPAEYKLSPKEYIDRYKDDAIKEMLMHGVPASITLSQGMLESANGNSPLAVYANNHFGIKCHKGWTGLTFIQDDDAKNECFRKYASALESFSDHSAFLSGRSRYAFLFDLKKTDYRGWAKGLKKAGYATNPRYPELLIRLIERHNLSQYDKVKTMPSLKPEPEVLVDKPRIKGRKIMIHYRVKYVIVKEGDNIEAGAVLTNEHVVIRCETMHSISQKYAVNLKSLYRKNRMDEGSQPRPGTILSLRSVRSVE